MICWNDQTLAEYHAIGLKRLGGQKQVRERIGGPWAIRYTLSHLVKDEAHSRPPTGNGRIGSASTASWLRDT